MSLADDLRSFIEDPRDSSEGDRLARRLFEQQCETIPAYGKFAQGREVAGLIDVPAVPETVYKGSPPRREAEVVKTFCSSGTSGASRTVIELSEIGLELMNAAILSSARRHLFPDEVRPAVLFLIPSPENAPDVIMVYGMDLIGRQFGCKPPRSFVRPDGLDFSGLAQALEGEAADGCPVFLAGGSFALVHFLEYCERRSWSVELPAGSRILDAGGFKGRSRSLRPADLRSAVEKRLGVAESDQVNLLGMTELASQIYDGDDRTVEGEEGFRIKRNDPWTASTVLDAVTGQPTSEIGMLKHVDLAIYDRPCSLVTADLGLVCDGGFLFRRRAAKVSHRGCSLAHEVVSVQ